MSKRVIAILFALLVLLVGCEDSNEITKIELGNFPDRIAYFIGEDNEISLRGCTVFVAVKSGVISEHKLEEAYWVETTHNVDLTKEGLYEVRITWMKKLVCRIPIQVLKR